MNVLPEALLASFDFGPTPRLIYGVDALDRLGALAAEIGARRVMVISDPGVVAAGHAPRAMELLAAAGLDAELDDAVVENPTTNDVDLGVERAREFRPDLLIGLGGGSSMDCAKGVNFLYTNGGQMRDYWGVGKATKDMLPMIAVPTTAGTGSEAQSFALISDPETHVKMACGDKKAMCRVALLDPKLTCTQPARVTALTGIDAISHALETYVTTKRNAMSLALSREAWRRLMWNFPRVLDDGTNLEARGGMQIGATLAGMAIEHSMLGATHSLANPLTAEFDLPHGDAIARMLPHVIRFNGEVVGDTYGELLECVQSCPGAPTPDTGAAGLADFMTDLVAQAGLDGGLKTRGVAHDALPRLAESAATQWTAQFNPREVSSDDLLRLYEAAF